MMIVLLHSSLHHTLTRRVFLIVLLDGSNLRITECKFVKEASRESKNHTMNGGHGKSLQWRKLAVITAHTGGSAADRSGSVQVWIAIDNAFSGHLETYGCIE